VTLYNYPSFQIATGRCIRFGHFGSTKDQAHFIIKIAFCDTGKSVLWLQFTNKREAETAIKRELVIFIIFFV
jgi:hypothetical protein